MKTTSDLKKEIEKILKDANVDEPSAKAKLLIEAKIPSLMDRILGANISEKDFEEIENLAKAHAKTGEPIQYLLGQTEFMGEKFKVTPDVLIPRDETEILVLETVKKVKEINEKAHVLDIGTGSGIIACMVAKLAPNAEVLAVDVSSDAILVAFENVIKLDLTKRVVLRKSDVFSALREGEMFDIIVSNPPYIPLEAKSDIDFTVKDFEPEGALFAKNNGLEFYTKIIENAKKHLKKGGWVLFECGLFKDNTFQADEIKNIFLKNGFSNVQIVCDLANIKRVIYAKNDIN